MVPAVILVVTFLVVSDGLLKVFFLLESGPHRSSGQSVKGECVSERGASHEMSLGSNKMQLFKFSCICKLPINGKCRLLYNTMTNLQGKVFQLSVGGNKVASEVTAVRNDVQHMRTDVASAGGI